MSYKIKVKPIKYMGQLQGHKIFIDGKKYPLQHGHWFTDMDKKESIKRALKEKK